VVSHERHADDADQYEPAGVDAALSDDTLLDLLDALVVERGRVAAAQALGVNFRTMATCCDTRRVSRRMRRALVDFHHAYRPVAAAEDVGADDTAVVGNSQALEQRVVELEAENAELRELVADRDRQLEELGGRLAGLEAARQGADDGVDDERRGHGARDWRPPRRNPGMPHAGVVTLEEQPDEEHAFGPAAPLVAEWRELVNAGGQFFGRVERVQAAVRRWEIEARMLGEFHLTLPPETFPLEEERRREQVGWRQDALAEARRELRRAKRARLLRRVLTMGLWQSLR
jgi:hypothetical protein